MLKVENVAVFNFKGAMRGARNPLESWAKSDTREFIYTNAFHPMALNFDETKHDKLIGAYIKCFTGHSNDYNIRYHSASGGMVTQLLIWLLEKKYINGAYVTKFNPQNELMVESFLATTKEEIIQSKSSKYSPVTLNTAIESIKSKEGKFIIVGVPCHIQGFRKYERIDKTFKNKRV